MEGCRGANFPLLRNHLREMCWVGCGEINHDSNQIKGNEDQG